MTASSEPKRRFRRQLVFRRRSGGVPFIDLLLIDDYEDPPGVLVRWCQTDEDWRRAGLWRSLTAAPLSVLHIARDSLSRGFHAESLVESSPLSESADAVAARLLANRAPGWLIDSQSSTANSNDCATLAWFPEYSGLVGNYLSVVIHDNGAAKLAESLFVRLSASPFRSTSMDLAYWLLSCDSMVFSSGALVLAAEAKESVMDRAGAELASTSPIVRERCARLLASATDAKWRGKVEEWFQAEPSLTARVRVAASGGIDQAIAEQLSRSVLASSSPAIRLDGVSRLFPLLSPTQRAAVGEDSLSSDPEPAVRNLLTFFLSP